MWQKEPWRPATHGTSGYAREVDRAARRRVAGGDGEADRVLAQRGALERGVGGLRRERVLLRDHEVELAEPEQRDRVLGLELARVDLELRVRAREPADRGRQQRAVRAREGGGAQDAGDVRALARERGLGGLELAQHRLRARDELRPRGREAAGAAGALEQLHAGLALERGELLGDGRRRVAERVGGGGDRAAAGELAQDAEAADVEHAEAQLTLRARNRNWC